MDETRYVLQITKVSGAETLEQGKVVTQLDIPEDRISSIVAAAFNLATRRPRKPPAVRAAPPKAQK